MPFACTRPAPASGRCGGRFCHPTRCQLCRSAAPPCSTPSRTAPTPDTPRWAAPDPLQKGVARTLTKEPRRECTDLPRWWSRPWRCASPPWSEAKKFSTSPNESRRAAVFAQNNHFVSVPNLRRQVCISTLPWEKLQCLPTRWTWSHDPRRC